VHPNRILRPAVVAVCATALAASAGIVVTTRSGTPRPAPSAVLIAVTKPVTAPKPTPASPKAPPAPVHLPDTHTQVTTPDGWVIRIELTGVTVTPVPNLAATPFSREAFWSGTATGRIIGKGKVNVDSATVKLQLQTGCQVDVTSGAQLSGSVAPWAEVDPSLSVTTGTAPSTTVNSNPSAGVNLNGSAQTTLKPGTINSQDIATRKLKGAIGWTGLDHVETKIDACAGPVTIRLAAGLSTSTTNGDNTIFTYSRPAWI
jgi:hypothetical protein